MKPSPFSTIAQRLELPDTGAQSANETLEARIGTRSVYCLKRPAPVIAARREAILDLASSTAGIAPRASCARFGLFDDLVAVSMANGHKRGEQRDQSVIATGTKVCDGISQGL